MFFFSSLFFNGYLFLSSSESYFSKESVCIQELDLCMRNIIIFN